MEPVRSSTEVVKSLIVAATTTAVSAFACAYLTKWNRLVNSLLSAGIGSLCGLTYWQSRPCLHKNRFPVEYCLPLTISSSQYYINVIGVKSLANQPEKPHAHAGGYLFHYPCPIKVYDVGNSTPTYVQNNVATANILECIPLPSKGLHYAITQRDYTAIFIELIKKTDAAPKPVLHQHQKATTLSPLEKPSTRLLISSLPLQITISDDFNKTPLKEVSFLPNDMCCYLYSLEFASSYLILHGSHTSKNTALSYYELIIP